LPQRWQTAAKDGSPSLELISQRLHMLPRRWREARGRERQDVLATGLRVAELDVDQIAAAGPGLATDGLNLADDVHNTCIVRVLHDYNEISYTHCCLLCLV
jgi:hypothetical protein